MKKREQGESVRKREHQEEGALRGGSTSRREHQQEGSPAGGNPGIEGANRLKSSPYPIRYPRNLFSRWHKSEMHCL